MAWVLKVAATIGSPCARLFDRLLEGSRYASLVLAFANALAFVIFFLASAYADNHLGESTLVDEHF